MEERFIGGEALARAVENAYAAGQTDYSLEPMALEDGDGNPVGKIRAGDHVVFCCRRGEREIELTEAFTDPAFDKFDREYLKNLEFVIMTMYHDKFKDLPIAFAPEKVVMPLAQVISEAGLTQFHCAESEKYAHVTFFFNGGVEQPCEGEDRKVIPSPKVATYDLKPEMSAYEVADECAKRIRSGKYDVVILNFANCDMVGHTGVFDAAVKAVEAVDDALSKVVPAILAKGGFALITADHGNADHMFDVASDGSKHPFTAHTTNRVPFIIVDEKAKLTGIEDGRLSDIAPTMLTMAGLEPSAEMTGRVLATEA